MQSEWVLTVAMHCGACANSVQNVLTACRGVSRAEANWQTGKVRVWGDAAQTSATDLTAALEAAGFDVAA